MMKLVVKPTKHQRTKVVDVSVKSKTRRKPANDNNRKKSKGSKSKGQKKKGNITCTPAGNAFLKTILAAPDFSKATGFRGIPDEYGGNIVVKNFNLTDSLPTYTAGKDLYIIQLPMPGIAYGYFEQDASFSLPKVINLVPYPDFLPLSQTGFCAENFQAFRYASNAIEFVPTVNEFTWGGSIQIWKSDVRSSFTTDVASPQYTLQEGIEGLSTVTSAKPQNIFPLNKGAYVPGFSNNDEYEFSPVITGISLSLLNITQTANTDVDERWTFNLIGGIALASYPYIGMGHFETTILKFPTIIAGQTGVIRCWNSMEFQVNPRSILYDYSIQSPPHDPIAMALLKQYRQTLPCGVDYEHNATFWEGFRMWVNRLSGVASHIPGPIGLIASGIQALSEEGHGLWG